MEGPLECGDVSPDSQAHAADGKRFAVCSFRNTRKEEEPAHQIQAMDPRPSRPAVGATQGIGLQGDFLSKEPQSLPDQRAADESGGYQSEEPDFSEMENLLCPGSSHPNLTQGENDHGGGGLIGDSDPGRALPASFSPKSEISSKQEADPSGSNYPKPADCLLARDLTWELLASGMAVLPGTRDVEGGAVLLLCAHSLAWLHPKCGSHELLSLLFYLRGVPRPEVQVLGLTVLVDARVCSPSSSLTWGLRQLQEASPGSVRQVLLVGKMPEDVPQLKFKQLPSHQSLLTNIPNVELPISLGGCLSYCHQAWLDFRMRLEALLQSCQGACALLQGVTDRMEAMRQAMESGVSVPLTPP